MLSYSFTEAQLLLRKFRPQYHVTEFYLTYNGTFPILCSSKSEFLSTDSPDWVSDPKYATLASRIENSEELARIVEQRLV